jgi:hypothetical protein
MGKIPDYSSDPFVFLKHYHENPNWFNIIGEVRVIQNVGDLYKPVVIPVQIDITSSSADIYLQKKPGKDVNGNDFKEQRFSLTRTGLIKIKNAARGTFFNTEIQYPTSDRKTYVVKTKFKYIGATEEDWLVTEAIKDAPVSSNDALRKAESGAQNACIREAFGLNRTFSIDDLNKPFVKFYWAFNDQKPEVAMAKIQKSILSTQLLYGARPSDRLLLDGEQAEYRAEGKDGGQK